MQIGELAKQAGVSVQTVRFYERHGLLLDPPRTESGYRIYVPEDLHRLRFIRQAKALGFSLQEVCEILAMRERGGCPCDRVLSMAGQHLHDIQQKIRQLARFEKELDLALKQWKKTKQPEFDANEFCALIERTMPNQRKTRNQE